MTTVSSVPLRIVSGTTVNFTRAFAEYPAADWSYSLFLAGPAPEEFAGEADGTGFAVTIAAIDSAKIKPGIYRYVERVSNSGGEVYEVGSGTLEVAVDLAEATAGDFRSHARKVLAAIEAVIEKRATVDQQSFTIAGRMLQRTPIPDLLVLRDKYRHEVQLEDSAASGEDPRRIGIRFRHA